MLAGQVLIPQLISIPNLWKAKLSISRLVLLHLTRFLTYLSKYYFIFFRSSNTCSTFDSISRKLRVLILSFSLPTTGQCFQSKPFLTNCKIKPHTVLTFSIPYSNARLVLHQLQLHSACDFQNCYF